MTTGCDSAMRAIIKKTIPRYDRQLVFMETQFKDAANTNAEASLA
jgi:hypothetical protein